MDALILLLISIFLLTIYGLVYIALRMRKGICKTEKDVWKSTFLVMLIIALSSGTCAVWLFSF